MKPWTLWVSVDFSFCDLIGPSLITLSCNPAYRIMNWVSLSNPLRIQSFLDEIWHALSKHNIFVAVRCHIFHVCNSVSNIQIFYAGIIAGHSSAVLFLPLSSLAPWPRRTDENTTWAPWETVLSMREKKANNQQKEVVIGLSNKWLFTQPCKQTLKKKFKG